MSGQHSSAKASAMPIISQHATSHMQVSICHKEPHLLAPHLLNDRLVLLCQLAAGCVPAHHVQFREHLLVCRRCISKGA